MSSLGNDRKKQARRWDDFISATLAAFNTEGCQDHYGSPRSEGCQDHYGMVPLDLKVVRILIVKLYLMVVRITVVKLDLNHNGSAVL